MADAEEDPDRKIANRVAAARDADVLVYNGRIERPSDDKVIDYVRERRRRKNVIFLISTYGGDPDAAFRIARYLQDHYERFTVMVAGFCKSAGTLIVLGAHSLILLDKAELGPLDVQIRKDDEYADFSSGLTPTQALVSVREAATDAFSATYVRLKSGLSMTTKTAADVAARITTGLYQPVMEQLDPMRIGEMDREMKVAWEYGERLTAHANNLKENALQRLVVGYPSHDFVIDRKEAGELFINIEEPPPEEADFCEIAHTMNRRPVPNPRGPYIFFMNDERPTSNGSSAQVLPVPPADGGGPSVAGEGAAAGDGKPS